MCVHKDNDLPGRLRCKIDTELCGANKYLFVLSVPASPSELAVEEMKCQDDIMRSQDISPSY